MIRKILIAAVLCLPLTVMAQDNVWERVNDIENVDETEKINPLQKYLDEGAVPVVDGKVVFSTNIKADGKSATDIYNILLKYVRRMARESNQLEHTMIVKTDSVAHEIEAIFEEWLVFKDRALVLDRTRMFYSLQIECSDGAASVKMSNIRYLYDEARDAKKYTAEELITDKEALNKARTKMYPLNDKFRRKTIDRKDFLFNKFNELLNGK